MVIFETFLVNFYVAYGLALFPFHSVHITSCSTLQESTDEKSVHQKKHINFDDFVVFVVRKKRAS